jgi:hypothetical protein
VGCATSITDLVIPVVVQLDSGLVVPEELKQVLPSRTFQPMLPPLGTRETSSM